MNQTIKIKTDARYTLAALLHPIMLNVVDQADRGFLITLAQRYQLTGQLSTVQIKAAGRVLAKYHEQFQDISFPEIVEKVKIKKAIPFKFTIGKDCQLAGTSDKQIKQLKAELTIKNPKYEEALKFGRWIGGDLTPKLRFYTEADNVLRFPRGFLDDALALINPQKINDARTILPEIDIAFKGELRKYQRKAVRTMLRHDFGVLESGTGSGKTVIALSIIAERKQPTLILVHSKELLHQWAERIKTFLGVTAGLIGDGHFEIKPITIAIINSAKNNIKKIPQHFGQLCVDECHRVPSTMFTQVVCSFDCKYMIGLSATAFRRDGLTQLIHLYLGPKRYKIEMEDLHIAGAVLKPVYIQQATQFDFDYDDNYSTMITVLTKDDERNELIISDILREVEKQSGIILVVSDRVSHCRIFADALQAEMVDVLMLTGQTANKERTEIVRKVNDGNLQVLISTIQLIGEGFDCPGLSILFLTTPITFVGRLQQIIGRILRPAKGKTAKVFDYCDPVGVLERSAAGRKRLYK